MFREPTRAQRRTARRLVSLACVTPRTSVAQRYIDRASVIWCDPVHRGYSLLALARKPIPRRIGCRECGAALLPARSNWARKRSPLVCAKHGTHGVVPREGRKP